MSGIDEQLTLWILTYKEWWYEDFVYCYKGFYARDYEDAYNKATIWLMYQNYTNFDTDEGEEDYVFVDIDRQETDKPTGFMVSDERIEECKEYIRAWNEEV